MTRRILLTLAVLLIPALAVAQSLAGVYDVWGRNPDGGSYSGTARIEDDGDTVDVFWNTTVGSYAGTGYRDGSTVLIDWGSDYLIIYTVMEDGELHGTWADGYALDRLSPR